MGKKKVCGNCTKLKKRIVELEAQHRDKFVLCNNDEVSCDCSNVTVYVIDGTLCCEDCGEDKAQELRDEEKEDEGSALDWWQEREGI